MGLWAGWNPAIKSGEEEQEQINLARQEAARIRRDNARENLRKARIQREQARFEQSPLGRGTRRAQRASFEVGREVGRFAQAARTQQPDFSREQRALRQMFGGGGKIWGLGPYSGTQVQINNALSPGRNGDMGTARLFGF